MLPLSLFLSPGPFIFLGKVLGRSQFLLFPRQPATSENSYAQHSNWFYVPWTTLGHVLLKDQRSAVTTSATRTSMTSGLCGDKRPCRHRFGNPPSFTISCKLSLTLLPCVLGCYAHVRHSRNAESFDMSLLKVHYCVGLDVLTCR